MEEVTEPLPPCICGRPRKQASRKLCSSCTMFKHRYGLTWPELVDQRKTQGKLCRICDRLTRRTPILFNGHRVCSRCVKILHEIKDPRRRAWYDLVLTQTGQC